MWHSYEITGKNYLLCQLVFGSLNCVVWRSLFGESNSTYHWRVDDRLTEGYSDSVLYTTLTMCTRQWANCTLPGGLESMPNINFVVIAAFAWMPSHDRGCTCKVLGISCVYLIQIPVHNSDDKSPCLLNS